jgi:hypothetical protein
MVYVRSHLATSKRAHDRDKVVLGIDSPRRDRPLEKAVDGVVVDSAPPPRDPNDDDDKDEEDEEEEERHDEPPVVREPDE